jgi:hypothetical protein
MLMLRLWPWTSASDPKPTSEPYEEVVFNVEVIRGGYEVVYNATSAYPTEKWLACRYGDVALTKRLSDETESGVVRYTKHREIVGKFYISIVCQQSGQAKSGHAEANK